MKLKLYRIGLIISGKKKNSSSSTTSYLKLFREKEKNILNNLKEKYLT